MPVGDDIVGGGGGGGGCGIASTIYDILSAAAARGDTSHDVVIRTTGDDDDAARHPSPPVFAGEPCRRFSPSGYRDVYIKIIIIVIIVRVYYDDVSLLEVLHASRENAYAYNFIFFYV